MPSPSKSATPATFQPRSGMAVSSAPLATLVPFISHTAFWPLAALRHRMSALPSPSKSATPATFQAVSPMGVMKALDTTAVPFISHRAFWPVVALRHRTSALPSPSKSPTPTACQAGSAMVARVAAPVRLAPLISHSAFWPLLPLRQRRSALPSPSKSLSARRCDGVGVSVGVGVGVRVVGRSTTMTGPVAVLLAGVGSGSVAVTVTRLEWLPSSAGETRTVTVALAAGASVPRAQVTVWLKAEPLHVPWPADTDMNCNGVGRLSVRLTLVAVEGPLLVTSSVIVKAPYLMTGCGLKLWVTTRSALVMTVVVCPAVLLAGTGSVSAPLTPARLTRLPRRAGSTKTRTGRLTEAWGSSAPRGQVRLVVPVQPGAATRVTPAGRVSVTTTPVAVEGPWLVTARV